MAPTPSSTLSLSLCHLQSSRTHACPRLVSYLITDNVVYLTITDKSYPRKLAFSYLDELSKEFSQSHGAQVDTVRKPYAFVGFGKYMGMLLICMSDL